MRSGRKRHHQEPGPSVRHRPAPEAERACHRRAGRARRPPRGAPSRRQCGGALLARRLRQADPPRPLRPQLRSRSPAAATCRGSISSSFLKPRRPPCARSSKTPIRRRSRRSAPRSTRSRAPCSRRCARRRSPTPSRCATPSAASAPMRSPRRTCTGRRTRRNFREGGGCAGHARPLPGRPGRAGAAR